LRAEPPDISLVVPCFDEEDSLPALLPALVDWLDGREREGRPSEVVLVDDGSGDRTPEILREAARAHDSVRVLTHPKNRGVGAAMRTGLHGARGDVVVCYDADMTYPLADVVALADRIGEADVATASPFLAAGGVEGVSRFRILMSEGAALAYRLVLRARGRGIRTFTCAFRAYRGEIARGIEFGSDGFPAAGEILGRLLLSGARVVEVPSVLKVRGAGSSSLRVGPTVRGHLRVLTRLLRWHPPHPSRPRAPEVRNTVPDVAALNRELPMRLLEEHRNPIIRVVEARRRRAIDRLCQAAPGERALDIGAEEGHLSSRLRRRGARVVGTDLDPAVLDATHDAVAADAEGLPFARGAFDLVLLSAVLEHVPEPTRAVAETLRVLKPGGRAVISVPDDRIVLALKRLVRALGLGIVLGPLSPGLAPGHLRVYSPATLRREVADHGRVTALIRDPLALSLHAIVRRSGRRA
jgi:dolichol-phosphate mannosyltransferase